MQTSTKNTLMGILFVNIATLGWATNVAIGRYIRGEIGPVTLAAARFVVAGIMFSFFIGKIAPEERRPGKDLWPLALMAATGIVLFSPLIYLGLRFTTAVNGALVNGMAPLVTAAFAAWLIKEPYKKGQLFGALLALFGVTILITGGSFRAIRTVGVNPGDLIILVAVAFWGIQSVASRRATRNRSPLSATILSLYMGIPVLVIAAIVEQQFIPVSFSPGLILVVIYLGIVPAGLSIFLWNTGIKKLGAGGAMVFYNMFPLYGSLLSIALLGEAVGPAHLVGGVLIIGGGVIGSLTAR